MKQGWRARVANERAALADDAKWRITMLGIDRKLRALDARAKAIAAELTFDDAFRSFYEGGIGVSAMLKVAERTVEQLSCR